MLKMYTGGINIFMPSPKSVVCKMQSKFSLFKMLILGHSPQYFFFNIINKEWTVEIFHSLLSIRVCCSANQDAQIQ